MMRDHVSAARWLGGMILLSALVLMGGFWLVGSLHLDRLEALQQRPDPAPLAETPAHAEGDVKNSPPAHKRFIMKLPNGEIRVGELRDEGAVDPDRTHGKLRDFFRNAEPGSLTYERISGPIE